jgi:hypothetical protein
MGYIGSISVLLCIDGVPSPVLSVLRQVERRGRGEICVAVKSTI